MFKFSVIKEKSLHMIMTKMKLAKKAFLFASTLTLVASCGTQNSKKEDYSLWGLVELVPHSQQKFILDGLKI